MNSVTREVAKIDRKRQPVKARGRLINQDVADWLGCSLNNANSIVSGRVKLTEINAKKLSRATGVNYDWLFAGNLDAPIINDFGQPYTQSDFDKRQLDRKSENTDADFVLAQMEFAKAIAKVAAILIRGAERGKWDEYSDRLNTALHTAFFDKGENRAAWNNVVGTYRKCRFTETKADLKPILALWEGTFAHYLAQSKNRKKNKSY